NSRAYAEHPDIWESSYVSPAYQTAIAMFPEDFYPELLGMTLYLEWEAIYLPAMVKLYEYYGYNPLFYRLHVAIDNPANGHGAKRPGRGEGVARQHPAEERGAGHAGAVPAHLDRLPGLQVRRRGRVAVPVHQPAKPLRPDDRHVRPEAPLRPAQPRPPAVR